MKIKAFSTDNYGICRARDVYTTKEEPRGSLTVRVSNETVHDGFQGFGVAVTGSVGKTTTKEFISSVLDTKYKTNCTKGNFNNEIGLPLTMLRMTADHTAQVLEMGMNHRGEIEYLSRLASPKLAVITTIGTSHIEYLGSRENIRDAKTHSCRQSILSCPA